MHTELDIQKSLVESAGAEAESLTKDDWDLVLRDAKLIKFKKDEIIISEGDYFQRIFQLSAGRCRAEKRGAVLGYIDQHETFGEISFLQGEGATVSVIADDDSVCVPSRGRVLKSCMCIPNCMLLHRSRCT